MIYYFNGNKHRNVYNLYVSNNYKYILKFHSFIISSSILYVEVTNFLQNSRHIEIKGVESSQSIESSYF